MFPNRFLAPFLAIFLADFTVRTAYMAGKSPVLPVFAAELGAGEMLLGAIVAVSTLTGMLTKPMFGFLSDRYGQWIWMLIGTALFVVTPVLYLGVFTPQDLVTLRLVHGLATAIYGPVTLAYVARLSDGPRAELFGWFSLARTGGYVLGPVIGGALLSVFSAAQVYLCTTLIAMLAFVPVLALRSHRPAAASDARPLRYQVKALPRLILRNRPILAFGLVEMISRIGVYAVKAFLPLMILGQGGTPLQAGVFLSVQELAVAITRPVAGHLADRFNAAEQVAIAGLVCLSAALAITPLLAASDAMLVAAVAIGVGNGAFHPAALFMIARASGHSHSGVAFGVVGGLRNLGKLLGPLLGGALLQMLPVNSAFLCLSFLTLTAILPIAFRWATIRNQRTV